MLLLILIAVYACPGQAVQGEGIRPRLHECDHQEHEVCFNNIMHSLFNDRLMPKGDILDVGAHEGTWACMYACFDSSRVVHAVDPSPRMIARMTCNHSNMIKHNYAVSDFTGFMKFKNTRNGYINHLANSANGDVPIETIDNLWANWSTAPSFLHIDVEGYELQALRGARQVVTKFRPVFSVEMHVKNSSNTDLLLELIEQLNYEAFLINELCGTRYDCRNFLCFPRESVAITVRKSPMLQMALKANIIARVTKDTALSVFNKLRPTAIPW